MKFLRFLISVALTSGLVCFLNIKVGDLPPIGKILDPFHGFWQNAEKDALDIKLQLQLSELDDIVSIQYEDNLIPHIFANNDHDLYYAQGYLTAYHRLWQMEFITKVASGRVSEVLGSVALKFDRLQRRKGLYSASESGVRELQNHDREFASLTSYTEGVNAYISQLNYKSLPIEYKLLDYVPEKWSPVKTLLIQKYMVNSLNNDKDLENTNLVQIIGKERFDFLFPDLPADIDPIIPAGTSWDFDPVEIVTPDTFEIINSFAVNIQEDFEEGKGSNNWAVSGTKTESGYPILCNDPHLGLNLPMIWLTLQLNAPGINTYGVSIPGIPGITIGFNDSIAWGITNADRDLKDWYQINFKDDSRDEYLYDGKWLRTQKRIETIKVKSGKDFMDTVLYTHYGPVVYEKAYLGDCTLVNYALKWTVHNPSLEIVAGYKLNRAKNLDETFEAIKFWDSPPQNFAIATRSGEIAQVVQGNYPLKWDEQGKFLMDGSDPKYEWQGYIPKEHNARVINPERGFISSANQQPFSSDYPYYYHSSWDEKFRNRRINTLLTSMSDITIDDMKDLQNDNYYTLASESLPVMLDSLNKNELPERGLEIVKILQEWDYMADPNVIAPSYFQTWWVKMTKLLWDEFDLDIPVRNPSKHMTRTLLNQYPLDSAFDIIETEEVENINDLLTLSFIEAIDSVDNWKAANDNLDPMWYQYKNTSLRHMTQIKPFGYYKIPIGGYSGIINATGPNWGASWRMVIELGDEINAWGIYAGGQSGNPGSPAYNTFVDDWAAGNYFKINFWASYDDSRPGTTNIKLKNTQEEDN